MNAFVGKKYFHTIIIYSSCDLYKICLFSYVFLKLTCYFPETRLNQALHLKNKEDPKHVEKKGKKVL